MAFATDPVPQISTSDIHFYQIYFQEGDITTFPNLVPSVMAVLNMIKTTALLSKMETMQAMCFETLLLYPNETLIEVASNSTEVTEVLNLYCHLQIPLEVRLLVSKMFDKGRVM